jgi:hypothetical protein
MEKPHNLAEALSNYQSTLSKTESAQVTTAVVRYLVPALNGPKPQGKRMTKREIEAALGYLKTIPLTRLWKALRIIEKGFNMMGASPSSCRNYRSKLEGLIAWCELQGWKPKKNQITSVTQSQIPHRSLKEALEERRARFGYRKPKPSILITNEELELVPELRQELANFSDYCASYLAEASLEKTLRRVKLLLGWRVRYDNITLEELRLTSLIPYVQMKHSLQFIQKNNRELSPDQALIYEAVETRKAYHSCQDKAKEVENWLQHFQLTYGKGDKASTLANTVYAIINLAKYLYQNDTDQKRGINSYSDIPIIVRLREICRDLEAKSRFEPESIPYPAKTVPWEELEFFVKTLKEKADATQLCFWSPASNSMVRCKREKRQIGQDVQKMILMLLFIILPPRRPGTIRSLELRELSQWEPVNTIEQGKELPGQGFVPKNQLPKGEKARWIMRLRKFKTHSTFGDQNIEIPDCQFEDGSSFYEYLELWINEYRPMFNPVGNNLFVTARIENKQGKVITSGSLVKLVKSCTNKYLGVPISPKDFRRMFVTYIYNRHDITEVQRRGFAWMMGHDMKTQQYTYDKTSGVQHQAAISKVQYFPGRITI